LGFSGPIDPGVTTTVINSGTTFTASARPKNPVTGVIITDASVTANFYSPSKDPIHNLTDRAHRARQPFGIRCRQFLDRLCNRR
jgi:hypothetical protein